jgi:tetratricopeptide (TPR) repeat protein
LLWSSRGALLGVAVADDYSFLDALRFQSPLNWFGSMQAAFYWRPLSRQAYFSAIGPFLLAAPWLAAAVNAALIVGTALLLYRIARHVTPSAWVASAVAAGVLLSEPVRVLLAWPSGIQHLLGGFAAVLAVHEALEGRFLTAGGSALAAMLSQEGGLLAAVGVPLAAWRAHGRTGLVRAGLAVAVPVTLWAIGYSVSRAHGVAMPPNGSVANLFAHLPVLAPRALYAALSLEDVLDRDAVVTAYVLVLVVAAALLISRDTRRRVRDAWPVLATGVLWFAIGALPLSLLLPDWNAWRLWIPALGLTFAMIVFAGLAWPGLAVAWVFLRAMALLLSPGAITVVTDMPPANASHVSFQQITRLERITDGARRALATHLPNLPPHSIVTYWEIPRLAEFAFQGSRALRVWYGDSTIAWSSFGGEGGLYKNFAGAIEFRHDPKRTATIIDSVAIRRFQLAGQAMMAGRLGTADSILAVAVAAEAADSSRFLGILIHNRAAVALKLGRLDLADAYNRQATDLGITGENHWVLTAQVAAMRGDREGAIAALRHALSYNPKSPEALDLLRQLGAP